MVLLIMDKISIENKILKFLTRYSREVFKVHEIARRISITDTIEMNTLRDIIKELANAGKIHQASRKRYGYQQPIGVSHLIGKFSHLKNGFGIVETENPELRKIFIPPKFTNTALDDDIVSVAVFPFTLTKRKQEAKKIENGPLEGEVVAIIERSDRLYTGKFDKHKGLFFVRPDDNRFDRDIYISRGKTMGARPGAKVTFVIEDWKSDHLNPEGRIVTILGKVGEVSAEMLSVIHLFKLPLQFPADVMKEVNNIQEKIPNTEIKRRLDLRNEICFTIDPEDAKDFDDAVSLKIIDKNTYQLGVHIADVSYYVKEDSKLDIEALTRGTSVYLANQVIPMLPEKLSNELCSLIPHQDKLTYSVIINLSKHGIVKDYTIKKSVINSKRRFTYEEVQKIINTGIGDYANVITEMHKLSEVLYQRRVRDGSIDFETSEIKFKYDSHGQPIDIIKKTRLDAHKLIEEFMLLVNRLVAQQGYNFNKTENLPFIYRVHDKPEEDKIKELAQFVSQFGYSLDISGGVTSKNLQKLLNDIHGSAEEDVINEVAIRSMAKAAYSEQNIKHFGLGFKNYTHFTSPIRRYPDLMIHRLLHEYENSLLPKRKKKLSEIIPEICETTSLRERVAVEAERDSVKVMKIEYMRKHVGDEFKAIISGVIRYGLFIEIIDFLVEGLVRIRDLDDDYYIYDEKNYAFIGRNKKRRYRLGDKVKVKVVKVNPEERQIDFVIVD